MGTKKRTEAFAEVFAPGVADHPSPALAISSFTGSAAAFAAAVLAQRGKTPLVLAVTPGLPEADALADDLRVIEDEAAIRVLEFPPPLEDDSSAAAARLKTSAALGAYGIRPYPLVIVACVRALETGVARGADVARATVELAIGEAPAFSELQEKLRAAGYARVPEVSGVGEFAVRGGVLDAWSPDAERPVRAEYFGDELESLRAFDAAVQTSVKKLERASFQPVEIASGGRSEKLFALLPAGATALFLDHDAYDAAALSGGREDLRRVYAGDPAPAGVPTADFVSSPLPGLSEVAAEAARNPEVLDAARARLQKHLAAARRRGELVVEDDELSGGFEVPGLVVAAKSDRVLGARRRAFSARAKAGAGERLSTAMDVEPGELVVHVDHGVGRFLGSTEVEIGGERHEVFTVEYADGAKLHVPVAHAHLLSRYVGVKGEKVKLHRLDGKRWQKDKDAAQKAVADLASALLDTQAKRAVVPGFAYDVEAEGMDAFEAAFPYEETPDQLRAIHDVKRDMASRKPMDRLICGDAGYGKTEVALRAAYVAALNGKQTVLLAPTTVLAQQHYETFLARFDGTPVRVEAMSRFQTEETKRGTRARLLSGATDVVVGTHALLSGKVRFHDLGLVVIDEEQRFGVKHKEHLKALRATADVLTMSATPIPRTLYLSLTGARDLSVLKTPPRERVAVETKIVRDSDETVRAAIARELARGGQVYYLYNRVLTISRMAERLKALAPGARVEIAHGQMPSGMLAEKMRRFAEGRADVLLCTSIVESGLDIPRANTIVVDRADRFGMAELYQIRGRVGRSTRQGYAYFLLPAEGLVDSEARERLAALKKHSAAGSGFDLSMRDLELRGAGNLLGREQSGHVAAVGFQLYCQLLQRTIAKMRGEDVPDLVEVTVNLDFLDLSPGSADPADGACLPYDYVEEESQRMDFHKRLAETTAVAEVRKLARELADRYGRLPPAAARLVKIAEFRVRCAAARVSRLDVRGERAVFRSVGRVEPNFVGKVTGKTADAKIASLFKLLGKLSGSANENAHKPPPPFVHSVL
ncbi:MAG: transcription-repair coupling factor [Kiritimatiellae bacterium]|nr:transcription-repair coupling factor [Kiritimatiellia bacterium]